MSAALANSMRASRSISGWVSEPGVAGAVPALGAGAGAADGAGTDVGGGGIGTGRLAVGAGGGAAGGSSSASAAGRAGTKDVGERPIATEDVDLGARLKRAGALDLYRREPIGLRALPGLGDGADEIDRRRFGGDELNRAIGLWLDPVDDSNVTRLPHRVAGHQIAGPAHQVELLRVVTGAAAQVRGVGVDALAAIEGGHAGVERLRHEGRAVDADAHVAQKRFEPDR